MGSTALIASQTRFLLASETVRGLDMEFVALQIDGLDGGVFLGEDIEDGLVFLLELIQVSHDVLL